MSAASGSSKLWLLPIVIALCGLMLVPASAVIGAASAAADGASALPSAVGSEGAGGAGLATAHSHAAGSNSPFLAASLASSPTLVADSKIPGSWVQRLASGSAASSVTPVSSYPNLELLEHPAPSVAQSVNPGYVAQPAPLGIADFGLGATPYVYSSPHFVGSVTFSAAPNVTDPGAITVINPSIPHLGDVGSIYEFGIQLNTVLTNVSVPGTNQGVFWTQNVVNVNDTGIHFVDDIFNFSANSFDYISPGSPPTILSGCTQGNVPVSTILSTYGGVYQCVGQTVPISAASYPLTIDLFNNVTVTVADQTLLTFGYSITGQGGLDATGISDAVTFNNPNASVAPPPYTPGFTVNGTGFAPTGLLEDSEMVLVGSIGGANSVFRSINGTLSLEYSNASAGGWTSVPSAYNFGGDTGETSTGIAGTWSGTTENINQGPSFLYGLWNAVPYASVAPGSIELNGTISPSYGFVFVSNVAPDAYGSNFSWAPTNASGGFTAYLPPSIPPGTGYYVRAFAGGDTQFNAGPYPASAVIAITMTTAPPGSPIDAPLYMQGNAQAAALADALTGSANPPFTFSNLVIAMNISFNHLNDFGYPSFVIFQAEGVTQPLVTSNLVQGNNSPAGTFYFYDINPPTGLITGPILLPFSLENYSQQLNVLTSVGASLTDQDFAGDHTISADEGGYIQLWQDSSTTVSDITQTDGAYAGVFVGMSTGTDVTNVGVTGGANGVDDVSSIGTVVWNVSASGSGSFGLYGLASSGGTYSWFNVTQAGTGVYAGGYVGPIPSFYYYAIPGISFTSINDVNATANSMTPGEAIGVELYYSNGNDLNAISASQIAAAAQVYFSNGTTVAGLSATFGAGGFFGEFDDGTVLSAVSAADGSYGVEVYLSDALAVTTVSAAEGAIGVTTFETTNVSVTDVTVTAVSLGVGLADGAYLSVSGFNVSDESTGVAIDQSTFVSISQVIAVEATVLSPWDPTMMGLFGVPLAAVVTVGVENASISGVSTMNYPVGVYDGFECATGTVSCAFASSNLIVHAVNVTDGWYAVLANFTESSQFIGIDAFHDVVGVAAYQDSNNVITGGRFVDESSYGVWLDESIASDDTVWMNVFIGDNGATSVYDPSHIQAFDASPSNLWYQCLASTCIGNYWADWHTLAAPGVLAPYYIPNGNWDYYPILNAPGQVALVFQQSGLPSGTTWSVSLAGTTETTSASSIEFDMLPGVYPFTVGTVAGYTSSPTQGNATAVLSGSGSSETLSIVFKAMPTTSTVTVTESGLPTGASWTAIVAGHSSSSTTSSISFAMAPGTYQYQILGPAGYLASPAAGSFTLGSSGYAIAATFAGAGGVAQTVTVMESGLPSGTTWTAIVGGANVTATGSTVAFSVMPGTYSYQIAPVRGYVASPSGGSITVGSSPYLLVTSFGQVTYAVTVSESGLAAGTSWSATLNGATQATGGASITWYLPNGSYAWSVASVNGYSLSSGSGMLQVAGAPAGVAAGFTSTSSSSSSSSDTLYADLAIAVAVIALIVAILALVMRGRGGGASTGPASGTRSAPPQKWNESDAGGSSGGATGPSGGSGGN